jgi:hypothetical protein
MRGKGKKRAMAHVNLRIPVEVLEFYKKQYPDGYTQAMRDTLVKEVKGNEPRLL